MSRRDDAPPPLAPDLDDLLGFERGPGLDVGTSEAAEPFGWCRLARLGRPCRMAPNGVRRCEASSDLQCAERRQRAPEGPHGAVPSPSPVTSSGNPAMPLPDAGAPAPAASPSDYIFRDDAERLLAQRLFALNLLLDQLEDEGVAAIAAAVAGGDEAKIADADPELVKAAFMRFTADFAKRIEEVATIPAADLAAAVERVDRAYRPGRARRAGRN